MKIEAPRAETTRGKRGTQEVDAAFLAEIRRFTKPGGVLILEDGHQFIAVRNPTGIDLKA